MKEQKYLMVWGTYDNCGVEYGLTKKQVKEKFEDSFEQALSNAGVKNYSRENDGEQFFVDGYGIYKTDTSYSVTSEENADDRVHCHIEEMVVGEKDDILRLIPTVEEIRNDYNEIIQKLSKLKTKEDVVNFGKDNHVTMEINYGLATTFDSSQPIEVIRCENWNNLDYIYYSLDGSKPMFDVWCDFEDANFISDITIDVLEDAYVDGIKWLWEKSCNNADNRRDIISFLHMQGISYTDMKEIYGFEPEALPKEKMEISIVFEYAAHTNKIVGCYKNEEDAKKKHEESPGWRYIEKQTVQL